MTFHGANILLLLSLAVSALPARVAAVDAAEANRPPSVLLIVADDLGWSDLGCYGSDFHETPHLDRLAEQSLRFRRAYAAAPVCSPTRAALLTGKYPAALHITTWYESALQPPHDRPLIPPVADRELPLAETTLAELLHERGYFTAHVGKWHLGDAAHYPEAQGFDLNIGGTFWGAVSTHFYPYHGTWSTTNQFRYVPGLPYGQSGEYLSDRLTDEAIKVLDRVSQQPFFLSLWYYAVHTPIEAKPDVIKHYQHKAVSQKRPRNAGYAAMVHSLDENIGRLLRRLDELQPSDRTLVVFTSDNGGYINEYRGQPVTSNAPLRSGKGSLYEGGLRVPLLIRWPGVAKSGATCDEPVVTMDLFTTIARSAGAIDTNHAVAGSDLRPLLSDPQAKLAREALFFHFPHYYPTTTPAGAVVSGKWKLIEYFEDNRLELYDVLKDISEKNDLSKDEPAVVQRLRDQLHHWRKEVGARMPQPNPATRQAS
jgi:arylsulfatase A-like enzyme